MARLFYGECQNCGKNLAIDNFVQIDDYVFPKGYVPICFDCLKKEFGYTEDIHKIDRLLQYMGIPFMLDKWLEQKKIYKENALENYIRMYKANKFQYVDWNEAYEKFKNLEEENQLVENLSNYSTSELNRLRKKWGEEYVEDSELYKLEKLEQDILNTYVVSGDAQKDPIRKLCKISLLIDQKMREGEDIDKLVKSYDNLCKIANLNPKMIKDANDFGSVGEIFAYLEKNDQWLNEFYDWVERDIVDKTMQDIQRWTRNLYVNENTIAEDIAARVEALRRADELEENLNAVQDDGLDEEELEDFEEQDNFDPTAGLE